jgi:hypothetical protein
LAETPAYEELVQRNRLLEEQVEAYERGDIDPSLRMTEAVVKRLAHKKTSLLRPPQFEHADLFGINAAGLVSINQLSTKSGLTNFANPYYTVQPV